MFSFRLSPLIGVVLALFLVVFSNRRTSNFSTSKLWLIKQFSIKTRAKRKNWAKTYNQPQPI
jgi:hypothetical protein